MGKILGIKIQNYGSLKDITLGQVFSNRDSAPLGNIVAIIGPSGNGKSTLADAFGFLSDCMATDYEQDSICGTWELLADGIVAGGSQNLKRKAPILLW